MLYQHLSRAIRKDPAILEIAAPGNPPLPNILFAAVHYLLLESRDDVELRQYYPSLVADPLPPDRAWPAFRSFCLEWREQIHGLITRRYVQTNEPARSSYLLPAFHLAHQIGGGHPLALIEIGCSAGLNLCFDSYAFDVHGGETYGDDTSSLRFAVEFRGRRPPPLPRRRTPVARRIGIDLHPIVAGHRDDALWLEALVWPEQNVRRAQLKAALAIASKQHFELHTADASERIFSIMEGVAGDQFPCVFQTHALNQFSDASRARLMESIQQASEERPLVFISREAQLTLEVFAPGSRRKMALANTDLHGRWIEWLYTPSDAL